MQKAVNQEDCKKMYRLLGHAHATDVRFIAPDGNAPPITRFVTNEHDFLDEIKNSSNYGGVPRQVYVGLHDRKQGQKTAEGVIRLGALLLDIDRVDTLKKQSKCASDDQIAIALAKGKEVTEFLYSEYGIRAARAMSGNGCHVLVRLPLFDVNDQNRSEITGKLRSFGLSICNSFNPQFESAGVELDTRVFDLARITKVIGTQSVKGDIHRMTHFVDGPFPESSADRSLLNYILSLSPVVEDSIKGAPKKRKQSITVSPIPMATSEHCKHLLKKCPFIKQFLSTELTDYDVWVGIGGNLHPLGPAGLSLWDELSSKSHNYNPTALTEKWERGNLYVYGCRRLGCNRTCGVGMPINHVYERYGTASSNTERENRCVISLRIARERLEEHMDFILAAESAPLPNE